MSRSTDHSAATIFKCVKTLSYSCSARSLARLETRPSASGDSRTVVRSTYMSPPCYCLPSLSLLSYQQQRVHERAHYISSIPAREDGAEAPAVAPGSAAVVNHRFLRQGGSCGCGSWSRGWGRAWPPRPTPRSASSCSAEASTGGRTSHVAGASPPARSTTGGATPHPSASWS